MEAAKEVGPLLMKTEGVLIRDIPDSVLDDIKDHLRHYLVPLVGLADERHPDPLRVVGSGTLVTVGGRYYVLTAAHVWDYAQDFPTISLVLTSDYLSWFPIPRENLFARAIRGKTFEEFGPDLALVDLAPNLIGRISAHKSFLNLARQRDLFLSEPVDAERGLWAETGVSAELSKIRSQRDLQEHEADLRGGAFFSGIVGTIERDGWDYLDGRANIALPGVPATFGGLSGGGLWQMFLSRKGKAGPISWTGERRFRGVAFWQAPVAGQPYELRIRCHGPRSLFKQAWAKWGLPTG